MENVEITHMAVGNLSTMTAKWFPVRTTNQIAATNYSGWAACTVLTAR